MFTRAVVCAAIVGCGLPYSVAYSQEPRDELLSLIAEYRSAWSEGTIEARTAGAFGPAEVRAWWAGDRVRREYLYRGLDGARESDWQGTVVSTSRTCEFNLTRLTASTGSRAEFRGVPVYLRVLPNESWLEQKDGTPLEKWITSQPSFDAVVRTPEGGFAGIFSSDDDVEACAEAIVNGRAVSELQLGRYALIVWFNKLGLLTDSEYIGDVRKTQVVLACEWSDDPLPILKKYVRRISTDFGKTYEVDFEITVMRAQPKLPADAPSLAIPPDDLPFGTRVTDRTGKTAKFSYVGGDAGEAHYLMKRSARRLQNAVKP